MSRVGHDARGKGTPSPESRLHARIQYQAGRHSWLRLTPAYSVKVVEETIKRYGKSLSVLDPFCGMGTTALIAANHGHDAATTGINPFLTWLARVKTAHYSAASLAEAEKIGRAALDLARQEFGL